MKIGTVTGVNLSDSDNSTLNEIIVSLQTADGSSFNRCIPLDSNFKKIPIIGESVIVIPANSDEGKDGNASARAYYMCVVGMQNNVNHNALPGLTQLQFDPQPNFSQISNGIPEQSSRDARIDLGNGFVELTRLSQLQPFLGDVIHEGRFGQSIRFGYTPNNPKLSNTKIAGVTNEPTWTSTKPESPITIIRNTANESGYNKFVIEDINKDDSSIWLGSKQKIGLSSSNKFTLGVIPTEQYENPQIVINSDRVVVNSKKDSVLISGKKSVNISTNGWKADMDNMFNQIEELKNQIQKLNTAVALMGPAFLSAANAGGPVASLTAIGTNITSNTSAISSKLVEITTQLQLMKQ